VKESGQIYAVADFPLNKEFTANVDRNAVEVLD